MTPRSGAGRGQAACARIAQTSAAMTMTHASVGSSSGKCHAFVPGSVALGHTLPARPRTRHLILWLCGPLLL